MITDFKPIFKTIKWSALPDEQQKEFDNQLWEQMLDFSEYQLEDAYSRMEMNTQAWTKHTAAEIDFIEKVCQLNINNRILDLGCGQGRHSIELARRGYTAVTAYGFSSRLIKKLRNRQVII